MSDDIELFQQSVTVERKCREFADKLGQALIAKLELPRNIVVGFHIRHVLDPIAPTVRISLGGTAAEQIREANETASLQTLNHVIDTLYYDTRGKGIGRGTEGPKIERLFVWIDFLEKCPSPQNIDKSRPGRARCHQFDRKGVSTVAAKGNTINIGRQNNKWRWAHFTVCKNAFSDSDLHHVADFASTRKKTGHDKTKGDESSDDTKNLLTDYVCGAEKFCDDLGISHSLSGYRVITAAVYQLGRYACKTVSNNQKKRFGPNTITVLIRSESAFGVVLGATVILDLKKNDDLRGSVQKEVINFLETTWDKFVDPQFHFPKNTLFSGSTGAPNWASIENAVWGKDWRLAISPEHQLAKRLRDKILGGEPPRTDTDYTERCASRSAGSLESKWLSWSELTTCPVHAFLQTLRSYAGERLEGQFLTFGFVLGNPQLLTHTPRERPFPITRSPTVQGQCVFFTRDQLIKQVHLVAGPEERAVVIPYTRCDGAGPEGKIAAHLLEFDEAMEEFRAKDWAALWRDVFVPYLYYTERFPWAVAGFVGPGAVVRVFVDRTIAAYHDEKGWWDIRLEEITCAICEEVERQLRLLNINKGGAGEKSEDECRNGNEEELTAIFKTVEALLSVALQMSRFANPEAKGGMIVWLAGEGKDRWNPRFPYPELQPHEWVWWKHEKEKHEKDKCDFRTFRDSGIIEVLKRISDDDDAFPEFSDFDKQYSCAEEQIVSLDERLRKLEVEIQAGRPGEASTDDRQKLLDEKARKGKELIEIGRNTERFLKSIALAENLNTSEPLRDHNRQSPWLRGRALTNADGNLDYSTAKLVLQAAKQDGAVVVKQKQEIADDAADKSNGGKPPESRNVVVAFGQRLVPPGTTADSAEELGGTRRASARALMASGNKAVRPGSFVITVSSDGPLTIWVKREAADPAEFKIGAYREW